MAVSDGKGAGGALIEAIGSRKALVVGRGASRSPAASSRSCSRSGRSPRPELPRPSVLVDEHPGIQHTERVERVLERPSARCRRCGRGRAPASGTRACRRRAPAPARRRARAARRRPRPGSARQRSTSSPAATGAKMRTHRRAPSTPGSRDAAADQAGTAEHVVDRADQRLAHDGERPPCAGDVEAIGQDSRRRSRRRARAGRRRLAARAAAPARRPDRAARPPRRARAQPAAAPAAAPWRPDVPSTSSAPPPRRASRPRPGVRPSPGAARSMSSSSESSHSSGTSHPGRACRRTTRPWARSRNAAPGPACASGRARQVSSARVTTPSATLAARGGGEQVRTPRCRRAAPGLDDPDRRRQVGAAQERPERARRDPAADRRALEALGMVRHLEPEPAKRLLERRPRDAGLDDHAAADRVDLESRARGRADRARRASRSLRDPRCRPRPRGSCRRRGARAPRRARRRPRRVGAMLSASRGRSTRSGVATSSPRRRRTRSG